MMDIENYFQSKFTGDEIPHLVLTVYLKIARDFITNSISDMILWMEGAYVTIYDFFLQYLNPVVWY